MLLSSFINGKGLHPLLDSVADLIRLSRVELPDLNPLDLDLELQSIYKKVDGEDLFIVNELHKARGFRKLHLEIARIGSTLQILHCVFFPEPTYDLPIFGVDLVVSNDKVSAAIVDLSPVSDVFPASLKSGLEEIDMPDFQDSRKLPEWGSIFSSQVCFIKPNNNEEEEQFLQIIDQYMKSLIAFSLTIEPDSPLSPFTIARHKGQHYYCQQQKLNDKTRNVLSKTFSPKWADRYIDVVLFECPSIP